MAPRAGNKKVANSLVTLSSAAIMAVYAAGFMKTRAAAERMDEASNARRPPMPAPSTAGETRMPDPIEPAAPAAIKPTNITSPVMPKPTVSVANAPNPAPVATSAKISTEPAVVEIPPTSSAAHETPAATHSDAAPATVPAEPAAAPADKSTDSVAASTNAKSENKPAPKLWPKEHYNDGTFTGWGTSRHGDIQASVTIQDGRIVATSIAQCRTRYSCSWVEHLPGQVMSRQSPNVDYVSGATESANAFYFAVLEALNKAK